MKGGRASTDGAADLRIRRALSALPGNNKKGANEWLPMRRLHVRS